MTLNSGISAVLKLSDYHARLTADLETSLASLRHVLRGLENNSFSKEAAAGERKIVRLELQNAREPEALIQFETRRCFVFFIDAFADYLDRLIAVLSINRDGVLIKEELKGEAEILQYIKNYIEEIVHKTSQDRSITGIGAKLDRIPNIEEKHRATLVAYGKARNAIVHNKAVAAEDMDLAIPNKNIVVVLKNGSRVVIDKLPYRVEAGDSLAFSLDFPIRKISKGELLNFSEEDLEAIYLNLQSVLSLEVLKNTKNSFQ